MLTIITLTISFLCAISAAFLLGAWWASLRTQQDINEALRYAAAWKNLAEEGQSLQQSQATATTDTDADKYNRILRAEYLRKQIHLVDTQA